MASSTPRPQFTSGKDGVPILQEARWAPGSVWTGGKSRPHRDSIPDRRARSSVAIPTELPGPHVRPSKDLKSSTYPNCERYSDHLSIRPPPQKSSLTYRNLSGTR